MAGPNNDNAYLLLDTIPKFQSDILRGVPSLSQQITSTQAPGASPLSTAIGTGLAVSGLGGAAGLPSLSGFFGG